MKRSRSRVFFELGKRQAFKYWNEKWREPTVDRRYICYIDDIMSHPPGLMLCFPRIPAGSPIRAARPFQGFVWSRWSPQNSLHNSGLHTEPLLTMGVFAATSLSVMRPPSNSTADAIHLDLKADWWRKWMSACGLALKINAGRWCGEKTEIAGVGPVRHDQ
jgi:hypothetical protein